jgi:ElaB/YqjD/DUF883 family membrane-anchored ribosome-binding protein
MPEKIDCRLGPALAHCLAPPHVPEEQTMEQTNGQPTLQADSGNAQQAAEDLLDDAGAQVTGKAKELSSKAQQLSADFAATLRASTVERPFSALAIAAGVGFILGALHAANRHRADYRTGQE